MEEKIETLVSFLRNSPRIEHREEIYYLSRYGIVYTDEYSQWVDSREIRRRNNDDLDVYLSSAGRAIQDICHRGLQGIPKKSTEAIVTLIDHFDDFRYPPLPREDQELFLDYLVSESPYASCFFDYSGKESLERGYVVNSPHFNRNLVFQSIQSVRLLAEFKFQIYTWCRLVNKGVNPHVAFFFCTNVGYTFQREPFSYEEVSINIEGYVGNTAHRPFSRPYIDELKNFMFPDVEQSKKDSFFENPGYFQSEDYWRYGGISRSVLFKDFLPSYLNLPKREIQVRKAWGDGKVVRHITTLEDALPLFVETCNRIEEEVANEAV